MYVCVFTVNGNKFINISYFFSSCAMALAIDSR